MINPKVLQNLKRLGHDSFRLDGPPVIYVDPWKLPDNSVPADLILITHDHYDHCSPPDVEKISHANTAVITNPEVAKKIAGARVLRAGESITVGDIMIEAVPAYNTNKFRRPGQLFHPPEAQGNGYIITLNDERLYHAGDTDLIPEMAGVQVTVALLPVSGIYVMTAEEAFEAAKVIKAQTFVPMHYGDICGDQSDVEKFRYLCEEAGIRVAVV